MSDWYFEIFEPSGLPFRDRYKVSEGGALRILEDEDVLERFDQTIEDEYDRPFLDRLRAATKEEKAKLRKATSGRFYRWINGEEKPEEESVSTCKQILGIREGELPDPDPQKVRNIAVVETLKFIRGCRIPPAEAPKREMTLALYGVLAFLGRYGRENFMVPNAKRDSVMDALASTISKSSEFADALIHVREDIDEMLTDWIAPFMILADALDSRRPLRLRK